MPIRERPLALGRQLLSRLESIRKARSSAQEQVAVNLDPYVDSVLAIRRNSESPQFDIDASGRSVDEAAGTLRELGIVTLATKLERSMLLAFAEEVIHFGEMVANGLLADSDRFRMARASDTYRDLERSVLPVVDIRGGVDAGMIDIFHADKLFAPIMGEIREAIVESGALQIVEKASDREAVPSNQNLYVNRAVAQTRGLHVDSYGGNQYKIFIYLTDVLKLEDGPYCYAPTSHRLADFEAINRRVAETFGRNPTDILLCPSSLPMAALAKSGTVIISNQSGAHRGFPQSEGSRRVIGALNCRLSG